MHMEVNIYIWYWKIISKERKKKLKTRLGSFEDEEKLLFMSELRIYWVGTLTPPPLLAVSQLSHGGCVLFEVMLGNITQGQSQSSRIWLEGSDNIKGLKQVVLTSKLQGKKEGVLVLGPAQKEVCIDRAVGPVWPFWNGRDWRNDAMKLTLVLLDIDR